MIFKSRRRDDIEHLHFIKSRSKSNCDASNEMIRFGRPICDGKFVARVKHLKKIGFKIRKRIDSFITYFLDDDGGGGG